MQLAYQAQGHGQCLQAFQAVLKSDHVVTDLPKVLWATIYGSAGFRCKQFPERSLGALDAAGKDGFLANKRPDEEMRIGNAPSLTRKPANCPVGLQENDCERLIPRQGRWRRIRDVGPVAASAEHHPAVR